MPLSPIQNPGAYIDIELGGRTFPGTIIKGGIRGLKSVEEWTTTRPIAGSGWVQHHKGRQPIKGIEIEVSLDASNDALKDAAWKAHYQFVLFIRGRKPPLPFKPPALQISGAPFRGAGVIALVYAGHDEPIWDTGPIRVVYRFDEATKSTSFPIETPEPAILDETNPSPKTFQETALVQAVQTSFGDVGTSPSFATISERYPGVGAAGATQ